MLSELSSVPAITAPTSCQGRRSAAPETPAVVGIVVFVGVVGIALLLVHAPEPGRRPRQRLAASYLYADALIYCPW